MRSERLRFAAYGLTLAVLLVHAWHYRFLTDDAFISFRYARNLAEGHGLVWNPGYERVEGYTNFLWVLLLSLANLVGLVPEKGAVAFGLSMTAGLWWVVLHHARASRAPGEPWWLVLVPLTLLAVTPSVAVWSTSGLETRMFELLVVGGALRLCREVEALQTGAWVRPYSGVILGLAALTRPDGVLLGCAAFFAALIALGIRSRRSLAAGLRPVLVFAGIVGAHLSFRHAYYGAWLPNTYYAKAPDHPWWEMGFSYSKMFALEYGVYLWLPLLVGALLHHRRRGTSYVPAILLGTVCSHWVGVLSVGGDHFEYRPFDLYFPFVYLLLFDGVRFFVFDLQREKLAAACVACVAVAAVWLPSELHEEFTRDGHEPLWRLRFNPTSRGPYALPGLRGVGRTFAELVEHTARHYVGLRAADHAEFVSGAEAEGRELKKLVDRGLLRPDTYLATGSGAVAYYSRLRTLNVFGLTDWATAHRRNETNELIGHDRLATEHYLRAQGVDFRACDLAHFLWRPLAARRGPRFATEGGVSPETEMPAYARVNDEEFLCAFLPQGPETAHARFERLQFIAAAELEPELGIPFRGLPRE